MVVRTAEAMKAEVIEVHYNPRVDAEGLKILLALESKWIASLNGAEFLPLTSADVSVEGSVLRFGPYVRKMVDIEWLRPNVVRIHGRARLRTQPDTITFYPGERLPSTADLRRRRREFQKQIGPAICSFFGVRKIQRQMLYSDRQHGIGGAYPRFIVDRHAVITVDPEEPSSVINGMMRAALLWAPLVRRPVAAIVPYGRHQTIALRVRNLPDTLHEIQWLQWDGHAIQPLQDSASEPETHVQPLVQPDAEEEVARICSIAPGVLQAVPFIAGKAISIRLRGLEVARISEQGTTYPLGEPIADVVAHIDAARHHGSRDVLARAHEERWLESNLLADMHQLLPSIDTRHIYPQVPSFVGEDRNIIDLLTVTKEGRLVVIEIKASADPELPFQALDYWIAVEKHRRSGDFQSKGYFAGCKLLDEPAVLILVAPLLAFHKTARRMIAMLPRHIPLLEIGINQTWKKQIKVLRRKGTVS
jgi:hypothetical protein